MLELSMLSWKVGVEMRTLAISAGCVNVAARQSWALLEILEHSIIPSGYRMVQVRLL